MSIAFFCEHCGKGHVVRDEHAGKAAQCSCGHAIVVPHQSEPPPLPAWPSPPPPALPAAPPLPAVAWPVERPTSVAPWLTVVGVAVGSAVVAALVVVAVVQPTRTNGANAASTTPPARIVAATPAARQPSPAVPPAPAATAGPAAAMRSQMAQAMSSMDLAPPPPSVAFPPRPAGLAPPAVVATSRPPVERNWPADAEWTTPTPGVREMRVSVDTFSGQKTQLRVYLPASAAAGAKLPCVFIAPAGSRLYHGMDLVNADAAEHWPYVRAGFAVVAYSVSGPLSATDADDPKAMKRAYDEFVRAGGGLSNAMAAIDYAIARRPEVDRERLYVAGHSSAGTVALLVAARDWRVKGCCAYAPVVDLESHFAASAATLDKTLFAFKMRLRTMSPIALPKPHGPVMLFRADDDATVAADDLNRYVERLGARLVTAPAGGHYQSMIDRGIPAGIDFLKQLDASPQTRRR